MLIIMTLYAPGSIIIYKMVFFRDKAYEALPNQLIGYGISMIIQEFICYSGLILLIEQNILGKAGFAKQTSNY